MTKAGKDSHQMSLLGRRYYFERQACYSETSVFLFCYIFNVCVCLPLFAPFWTMLLNLFSMFRTRKPRSNRLWKATYANEAEWSF